MRLKITGDNRYSRYVNDSLFEQGSYTTELSSDSVPRVHFGDYPYSFPYRASADSLYLEMTVNDGPHDHYVRSE
jgi:hypothetical protein